MSNYSQNVLFKEILKTSIQKRHVIHFHGNNNIKIVRLSNSIECCTHKALALKQQKIHHPLCYLKATILDPRLNTPECNFPPKVIIVVVYDEHRSGKGRFQDF